MKRTGKIQPFLSVRICEIQDKTLFLQKLNKTLPHLINRSYLPVKLKRFRTYIVASLIAFSGFAFSAVAEVPGESAELREEIAVQPTLKVAGGSVEITLPGEESRQVLVYSLTGQLVKNVTAEPGVTVIELSPGYYIVKCDRLSQRVIVR